GWCAHGVSLRHRERSRILQDRDAADAAPTHHQPRIHMPSPHTITVTYTPGVESSWSFSPMTLQMTQSGNITFQRAPGPPQWTFQTINLLPANCKLPPANCQL
ncbi:MAG: hypothetical protein LH472_01615, partial [Pyrinomonadaceae bacterium]|nr:hypothetical protein [Pyrinomonadaceae bacterium]